MPLRIRLSIAFVAIVLVPLTVTAFLVRNNVKSNFDARANALLGGVTTSTDIAIEGLKRSAGQAALSFAERQGPAPHRARVGDAVRDKRVDVVIALLADYRQKELQRPDFMIVADPKGGVIAGEVYRDPRLIAGVPPPQLKDVAALAQRNLLVGRFSVHDKVRLGTGSNFGSVIAGYWLDAGFLNDVVGAHETELTLVSAGVATATTFDDPGQAAVVAEAADQEDVSGFRHGVTAIGQSGVTVVASLSLATARETTGRTTQSIAAVIIISLLMAGLFGWLLARVTTRPLAELGEAANSVASGRLDTTIEVRSRDEVGKLAMAFNTMTEELRTYIQALQDSRDELKRNLTRLGDTLSSTHDLKKMLAVILETAMVTIRAEAGALMLFSGNRDELYLKVGRGLDGRLSSSSVRVQVGDGVAGRVAEVGEAVRGTVGLNHDQLRLAPNEPRADSVISVPLKSQGRVIGVLNLYDRVDADEFDDNDLATIRSFANQATVAIDNVLLHQEAQRLSITDGLTGLWNYRYFQMQFDKEIERASRFGRPLALLVMDLDRFKSVNDQYGHQRGDSVLIELATRVKGAIRDVDILARYGGEEFVLILPETDLEGAVQAAGKICELVRGRRFGSASETPLRITVSIGVAVYPEHGRAGASLVKSADAALYAAKEAGRDGYWIAAAMPDIPGEEELAIRPPRTSPDVTSPVAGLDEMAAEEEADLGTAPSLDVMPAPDQPAPDQPAPDQPAPDQPAPAPSDSPEDPPQPDAPVAEPAASGVVAVATAPTPRASATRDARAHYPDRSASRRTRHRNRNRTRRPHA